MFATALQQQHVVLTLATLRCVYSLKLVHRRKLQALVGRQNLRWTSWNCVIIAVLSVNLAVLVAVKFFLPNSFEPEGKDIHHCTLIVPPA